MVRPLLVSLLAGSVLAACSSLDLSPAGEPLTGSAAVGAAIERGDTAKAVALAEAAVARAPLDAGNRALLGRAYLKAGRMVSARDTLSDAVALGDDGARTALMLALAQIGAGQPRAAVHTVEMQGVAIPAAERGLALALAGDTARGVQIILDGIRYGENDVKARQNLAYAFALDGRWQEARTVAEQDLPADLLDERITEWALTARPEQAPERVAGLLGTTAAKADAGQPLHLALTNFEEAPPAEASGAKPALAAVNLPEPEPLLPAPATFGGAAAPEATMVAEAPHGSTEPVPAARMAAEDAVAPGKLAFGLSPQAKPTAPKAAAARAPASSSAATAPKPHAGGSHVAQLGSFTTLRGAEAGWDVFQSRYANLRNSQPVITSAVVNGRRYFRVAAGGFDAREAAAMCGFVKAGGRGCLPIARERAGAPVNTSTRMANAG